MNLKNIDRPVLAIAEKHNISIEEAEKRMTNSKVYLVADSSIGNSFEMQVSFLTTLNVLLRVFKGGVGCQVPDNTPNLLPFKAKSFNELIEKFGGTNNSPKDGDIKILFGSECYDDNCIESVFSGWRGGVNLYKKERVVFKSIQSKIPLGAILSSSLSSFYAFCKYFQLLENNELDNTGLSLWNLSSGDLWYEQINEGPAQIHLPQHVWLLGLGHLGQAYTWIFGFMPYKKKNDSLFLLQDADIVGKENIGAQILCNDMDIGRPKTRVCADFLESFEFRTQIIEKPYIAGDLKQEWMSNFPVLLNGVDNLETRKGITKENLRIYLDGATNGKFSLFDSFTMKNVFVINDDINQVWKSNSEKSDILNKNLYDRYEKEEGCGIIGNIGISTPFVGTFGAAITISELIRAFNGGKKNSIISLQMRDVMNISLVEEGSYSDEFRRWAV